MIFILISVFLFLVSVTLAVAVGVLSFYIVRFAKMIFSVEDQLSNVIKVLIDL